jgi:hypothetical protein
MIQLTHSSNALDVCSEGARSNLGLNTRCIFWGISWVSLTLQANSGMVSRLGHYHFLTNPFHIIIHRTCRRCLFCVLTASWNCPRRNLFMLTGASCSNARVTSASSWKCIGCNWSNRLSSVTNSRIDQIMYMTLTGLNYCSVKLISCHCHASEDGPKGPKHARQYV